jgi:hypothetical protein
LLQGEQNLLFAMSRSLHRFGSLSSCPGPKVTLLQF